MFLRMILVTIMGILLLGWVIFCGIQWIRQGKRAVFYGDFTGHIKCEKCGREYTVSGPEFAKGSMVRSKSTVSTGIKGGMMIRQRKYSYYARKFHCPFCKKRVYGQVLNINELQGHMTAPAVKAGIRWLILMCVGGFLIMAVMGIFINFADAAARRRTDALRQEYYYNERG
ncbi:MAG TPA: hypothetical protein IAB23_08395 [Candidatus Scybalocola faecavium]|nr:hypothetical protein [Candidatus Scybalocola faecavium]